MKNEIVQLIRSSAGIAEVIKTYMVSGNFDDTNRKEKVAQIEDQFKSRLSHMDADELEIAVEEGFADEANGDTLSIVWSSIDEL